MGTFIWIVATTLIGYVIGHYGLPEMAAEVQHLDLIASSIGFGVGVISRIIVAIGGADGISAFFEIIGDIGGSLLD